MKILYHHRTRSKDGQFVHIEELTKALKARGHEIIMVGPAAAEEESFGAEAGFVATLKKHLPRWIYEIAELSYALFAYRRLAKAYREHQPDCLYERYNLFMPAGVWLKRRFGLPMLLEVNAPIFEERQRFDGLALARLAAWSQKYTWRGADMTLPVTDALADYVRASGVPEERITVIQNGIDPGVFGDRVDRRGVRRDLGLENARVLGFTGFMREWHGLDRVISFMAGEGAAANLHFLAVGDGPVRGALERQVKDLGLDKRVTFTGLVERCDIPRYVGAFDIALQPDVVPYASPLKLFEYLALGCAVIAPDTANIREVLSDGENAVLFDAATSGAFESALVRLVGDQVLRQKIGAAAARTVVERDLTWPGNARRVEKLFRALGVAG